MSDFEFTVERRNDQGQAEAWLATAGNIGDARTLFRTMAALHPGQWITLRQRACFIASTRQGLIPEAKGAAAFGAWRGAERALSAELESEPMAIVAGQWSLRPRARRWSEPYE